MSWDSAFAVTNAIAIIGWLILWFAPRTPLLLSAVMYLGVALLCLIYLIAFAGFAAGAFAPGGPGGAGAGFSYDLPGIRDLFATDAGVVIGWTHYLAFDLFAGLWIARDADAKGVGRLIQTPILVLTLLAGPVGLLIWLVVRERRTRQLYPRK